MEAEISNDNDKEPSLSDSDWDNRKLCSDGNCIGVIGADGHCNECGKKYQGPLPEENTVEKEELPPEEEASPKAAEADEETDSLTDSDWETRKLCSDGNCIGVIGPDGRCKECGKPYAG